jgi:superfamily II DNA or RNA helicase
MQLRPHQLSAYEAMERHAKGQIIVPTGGGKTLIAIKDAIRRFNLNSISKTIIVVAPRILLAEQLSSEFLEEIENVDVMHVHSGETHHFSSTKTDEIENWYHNSIKNQLIFTTYHSLHRITDSLDIEVDTIYFDEAHNAVQRNFIEAVEHFSMYADRCYFFTATPKHSLTPMKAGMNDPDIFGQTICKVPAPKLVKEGYILPPKVKVYKTDILKKDEITFDVECNQIIDNIDDHKTKKILVCAKSTKQIQGLIRYEKFLDELEYRGYDYMYITSKTGAVINGKKVSRDKFFDTLSAWGKDDNKKFVVLHHSILAEGINVKGLEAVLFLRSMDYIGISQTIGRVIRKGGKDKTHGLVCVPVYSKVGISTARKVQAVVDTVFVQGEPAISVVKR